MWLYTKPHTYICLSLQSTQNQEIWIVFDLLCSFLSRSARRYRCQVPECLRVPTAGTTTLESNQPQQQQLYLPLVLHSHVLVKLLILLVYWDIHPAQFITIYHQEIVMLIYILLYGTHFLIIFFLKLIFPYFIIIASGYFHSMKLK